MTGTSPRMRGKLTRRIARCCTPRNIPAYAGKTLRVWCTKIIAQEHPRVCGENVVGGLTNFIGVGTSPRMRGKQGYLDWRECRTGNIPAYAGKTPQPASPRPAQSEHPRVCGENCRRLQQWGMHDGTSPRMRGKPRLHLSEPAPIRNIPAYAGKTSSVLSQAILIMEHPRVCGENAERMAVPAMVPGTSPRMRGKLHELPDLSFGCGNIPAYAGKTRFLSSQPDTLKEHPRVCGENLMR